MNGRYGRTPAATITKKVNEELVNTTSYQNPRLVGKSEEDIELSIGGIEIFGGRLVSSFDSTTGRINFYGPETGLLKGVIL